MSFFDSTALLPEDPILNIPILFKKDPNPTKVNLGIGSYKDAEGHSLVLPSVKQAEKALLSQERSKDYIPIGGTLAYVEAVKRLVFGNLEDSRHACLYTAQTLGGTGALRLGAEFLAKEMATPIFCPAPTWPNHPTIFSNAGLTMQSYRYLNPLSQSVDFEGMCEDVGQMSAGSTLLLHASCHNPTGIDLSKDQWKELSQLVKKARLIPFFDNAYQGFKESIEEDAYPIRLFVKEGHELFVASSFSKNFGLYGERVGALSIYTKSEETVTKVGSQIRALIRGSYSNPPIHGAELVATLLNSSELKEAWMRELATMQNRIKTMRHALFINLQEKMPARDFSYIDNQHGFFSLLGLTAEQTNTLTNKYGIYLPKNGRINIAGLNLNNMDYVVQSIVDVTHP